MNKPSTKERCVEEITLSLINIDRIPLDRKTLRFTYAMQATAEFPAIKVAKRAVN